MGLVSARFARTEVPITLIFAIVPSAIGFVTLRLSVKDSDKASVKKRIYYVILGFAGLFMWASAKTVFGLLVYQ